jgi:hypothetical protein
MKQGLLRRLVHLEERHGAPPKPWLVLMPGQPRPDPLPVKYGGVVQVRIYDASKPRPT